MLTSLDINRRDGGDEKKGAFMKSSSQYFRSGFIPNV
jgi:hypothetical protein